MGLVSRVLPDDELLDACLDVAESMARYSPYGLAMTKDVLWANLEVSSLEAAVELEDRNQLMLGFTENLPEAIRAFDAGRAPAVHRRTPPRHVPGVATQRPSHSRTRKAPRPAGSRSASASVDPAARLDRLEVADGGALVPDRARPSSTSSSMPWARSHSAWVRVARRRRAAGRPATSQVMSCSPRRSSGWPAALVAAVGPQPLGPGPVAISSVVEA